MFDSSENIRITISNDARNSVIVMETDEIEMENELATEIPQNEFTADNDDDFDDEDDDDSAEEEEPNKILTLQTPAFLHPKPIACWKPVTVENLKRITKLGIETICPNICLFFLHDECIEGEHCYNSHELPAEDVVRQRLIDCGVDNSAKLLRIIVARCSKLLQKYFHLFVDIFVEHQKKEHLFDMISICERELDKDKRFKFFQLLAKALIECGETYKTAMEMILFNVGIADQDIVDTLLNMNLVDGISVSDFLGVFQLLNERQFTFNKHIINRLMYLCTHSEAALPTEKLIEFAVLIFGILKKNRHVQKSLNKNDYKCYIQLYNHHVVRNGNRKN